MYLVYEIFPLKVAALVGVDYAGLKGDAKLLEGCQNLQNAAYWGRKFVALKVYLLFRAFPCKKMNTVIPRLSARALIICLVAKVGAYSRGTYTREHLFMQMVFRASNVN